MKEQGISMGKLFLLVAFVIGLTLASARGELSAEQKNLDVETQFSDLRPVDPSAEDGWWLNGSTYQENFDNVKAKDGFGVQLWVINPGDFFEKWSTPETPKLRILKKVKRNIPVSTVLLFINPGLNEKSESNVVYDMLIKGPDGKTYADLPGLEGRQRENKVPENMIQLAEKNVGIIVEDGDMLGTYTVDVVVRDKIKEVEIPLHYEFVAEENDSPGGQEDFDALEFMSMMEKEMKEASQQLTVRSAGEEKMYDGIIAAMNAHKSKDAIELARAMVTENPDSALARLLLISGHLYNGDTASAIRECEGLITSHPDLPNGYFIEINLYARSGDYDTARAKALKAISRFPGSPDICFVAGMAELAAERYSDASDQFKRALQIDETYLSASVGLARCLFKQGNREESFKNLQAVIDKYPQYVNARLALIAFYKEADKTADAVAECDELISDIRGNLLVNLACISVYRGLEEYDKAISLVKITMAEFPDLDKEMGEGLVLELYAKKGDYTKLEEYKASVNPNDPSAQMRAYSRMGELYDSAARPLYAAEHYRKAIEIDPSVVQNYYDLGWVLLEELQKTDEAITVYTKAVELAPDVDLGHFYLGRAYRAREMFDNAISEIKKAIEIDPEYSVAWCSLGTTYSTMSRFDEALEAFNTALKIDPLCTHAYNGIALMYQDQGRIPEAVEAFKDALRVDPTYWRAYSNLGALYYAQGNYDDAMDAFKKTLEFNDTAVSAYSNLGDCYMKKGNYQEAEREYKIAIEGNPDSSDLYQRLGNLYLQWGRCDDALTALQKSISFDPTNSFAYNTLAGVYRRKGMFKEALTEHLRCREIDPSVSGIDERISEDYLVLNKFDEALPLCRKLVEKEDSVVTHYNLARALAGKDLNDEAESEFKRALEKEPDSDTILSQFGKFYIKLKRFDEALPFLKKLLDVNPTAKDGHSHLIQLICEYPSLPRIKRRLLEDVKENPGDKPALLALSLVAEREGNKAAALKWLQKLEVVAPGFEPTARYIDHMSKMRPWQERLWDMYGLPIIGALVLLLGVYVLIRLRKR